MEIYGCILLRGLKTDYRAQNSNRGVADVIIGPRPNCANEIDYSTGHMVGKTKTRN